MSLFNFDIYNQPEIPNFYLANPTGKILYNLGTIYDRKLKLRYNTYSELTFTAPSIVDGVVSDYYDSLLYRRLVCVENIGNFMITKIEISNDGMVETKNVTCQSVEVSISSKKISLFNGVYTFYSVRTIGGVSTGNLLETIMSYIPDWSLGYVSDSLKSETRVFDVTDKTLYDFIINEVSQTFQCVFVFDTINKIINVYNLEEATQDTDIYISFDNLMENFSISESTEELATALTVIGGEDLSINIVNPIGSNIIYNFDYYKTTDWMEQDLIDAIDAWETKIDDNQETYADYLTAYRENNLTLLTLEAEWSSLNNSASAVQSYIDALIAYTTTNGSTVETQRLLVEASASKTSISGSMAVKQGEINVQKDYLEDIWSQVVAIHDELAFENNFTTQQLLDLDTYIIGNTYTNTNFIHTSIMTEPEVQDEAQSLYNQAVNVIAKVSSPRYTFEIDSANFAFLKEYEEFNKNLTLGCVMTVETKKGEGSNPPTTTEAVLLGIDFNYDSPDDFSLILSNRLRLDDEQFQYNDLFGSMVDTHNTTSFNSQKWNRVADAFDEIATPDSSIVVSNLTSSGSNNLVVFGDTRGAIISDANALYVSPTPFTPILVSGSTSASATFSYTFNTGNYSIIGRALFFEMTISLANISGSAANKSIYIPLPAFHKNSSNLYAAFPVSHKGITLNTGYTSVMAKLPPNSASLVLCEEGSAGLSQDILCTKLNSTTASFVISGYYFID